MNETIRNFGYPNTLVHEFGYWVVLARAAQPTLGSLILAAKCDATAFSDLPAEAHAELKQVTASIEAALAIAVSFAKINYLMLMMVDPHVHFHVLPRYEGTREWSASGYEKREFVDVGWPKVPELGHAVTLKGDELGQLVDWLKEAFSLSSAD